MPQLEAACRERLEAEADWLVHIADYKRSYKV